IPFALAEMQETTGRELVAQTLEKVSPQPQLVRTESGRIPFFAVHVVDGNESRFSAHRQPHIAVRQFNVDLVTKRIQALPLFLRVGFSHSRILVDTSDTHLVKKLHFAFTDQTRNGSGRLRFRRSGQRYVPFTSEQ